MRFDLVMVGRDANGCELRSNPDLRSSRGASHEKVLVVGGGNGRTCGWIKCCGSARRLLRSAAQCGVVSPVVRWCGIHVRELRVWSIGHVWIWRAATGDSLLRRGSQSSLRMCSGPLPSLFGTWRSPRQLPWTWASSLTAIAEGFDLRRRTVRKADHCTATGSGSWQNFLAFGARLSPQEARRAREGCLRVADGTANPAIRI